MGVRNCSRRGCDNIMCDTYILDLGYICYDCQNEFTEALGADVELPEKEMFTKAETFMGEDKRHGFSFDKDITADKFFNKYT